MKTKIIIFFLPFFALGCKSPQGEKTSVQNEAEIAANAPLEANAFEPTQADTLRIPIDDIHWLENGRWGYGDDYVRFYIDISVVGADSISGELCCVTQQGRKIDCADGEPNLRGVLKNGVIEVDFSSAWRLKPFSGRALIYKTGENEILWEVTKDPEGGSEIIRNIILEREKLPDE